MTSAQIMEVIEQAMAIDGDAKDPEAVIEAVRNTPNGPEFLQTPLTVLLGALTPADIFNLSALMNK